MHEIPLSCTSSPCNLLFLNPGVYGLVQATVGVGTALIWDFCVDYTRGGVTLQETTCKGNFIPKNLKLPKPKPAPKPGAKASSSGEHVQLFRMVYDCKKGFQAKHL